MALKFFPLEVPISTTPQRIRFTPLEAPKELPQRTSSVAETGDKVAMFLGENSKLEPIVPLAEAKRMAGPDNRGMAATFRETGWFIGLDGKWRWEIDDSRATFNSNFEGETTLGNVLNHPALLKAYPQIGNIRVRMNADMVGTTNLGFFSPGQNLMSLNPDLSPEDMMETIIHELQHTVQEVEGFDRGGSSRSAETLEVFNTLREDTDKVEEWETYVEEGRDRPTGPDLTSEMFGLFDIYQLYGGEVEARQTESRIKFTPIERRQRHPTFSRDVRDVDVLDIEKSREEVAR